jgi:uncharacterized protein YaaN involved in tellurite resistance
MSITTTTTVVTTETTTSAVSMVENSFDYEKKLALLTPEEREKCLQLTSKIDKNDLSSVQAYGSELSQTVAQNGNALLTSVRADNTSKVVELTNDLLAELNMIDINEFTPSKVDMFLSKIPGLNRFVRSIKNTMIKYDTITNNVEAISKKIGSTKIIAMRDNTTLQTIFNNNVEYIKQIRELILAAKVRMQELEKEIVEAQENPAIEVYEIQDMMNFKDALSKRIADMQTTEYVLYQNLFQIRATQGNNTAIANKSENLVNHVIPIWKNQLAISIIMNNQQASVEAQQKITETTNQILRKNAQCLRINSVNVAKANEEQIVTLDTLQKTTQDLIETITEVRKIHEQGERNRETIEQSLKAYTEQLLQAIGGEENV